MKRFISLLMVMMLLCMGVVPCVHAEDIAPYSSNFFTSYGTTLSKEGNGRIKIVFSTTGTAICNKLGVAYYEVERMDADGNWENVSGALEGSTARYVTNYTFSRYFNGVAGETYRVQVVFICLIGDDDETQAFTSGVIKAN